VWDNGPARVLTSPVADVEARVHRCPYRRKCPSALLWASEHVTPRLRVAESDMNFAAADPSSVKTPVGTLLNVDIGLSHVGRSLSGAELCRAPIIFRQGLTAGDATRTCSNEQV
jgi:hypothetical protein